MKKRSNYFLLALPLFLSFYSCSESCNCKKDYGCATVTATNYETHLVEERKTYCSETNFYTDQAISDSVNRFYTRHLSDNTQFGRADSVYQTYMEKDLKRKETGYYENLGYKCSCAK